MMIRHVLTKLELSCSVEVEIDDTQFQQIREHKNNYTEALEIEEKYDTVIENFKEFECELLRLGIDGMLFSHRSWHMSMQERRLISRRVSNLLSSGRMYIDHTKRHISAIYDKDSETYLKAEQLFRDQYEACFGYRLMEALRNHVQHSGMPFSYSITGMWLEGRDQMANSASLSITPADIIGNKKLNASVRKELDGVPPHMDIKLLIRQYIESISNVNNSIRDLVSSDVVGWQETLQEAIDTFRIEYSKQEPDKGITTLCAMRTDDGNDGEQPEVIHLFTALIDHRADLLKKNRHLSGLSKKFVTGQVESYIDAEPH